MSKLDRPLSAFPGRQALAAICCGLCASVALAATPARADEFVPLNSRPATLTHLDVRRHVPGVSPALADSAAGVEEGDQAALYRQVNRNFKFGLRYARAVFSLAPAEAREDDHYVFLNLVGML